MILRSLHDWCRSGKWSSWWLVPALACCAASVWVVRSGFLHPEGAAFIQHYLADGPLLPKLFDPRATDWGMYQARELSCLIDALDTRALVLSAYVGHPTFLSLSHYLLALLTAAGIRHFGYTRVGLDKPAASLWALVFLSTPAVFLGGTFYRSAKISAAAGVVGIILLLTAAPGPQRWSRWLHPLALFVTSVATGLCDRQGVALVAVAAVISVIRIFPAWGRRPPAEPAAMLAALGFLGAYDYWISPAITVALHGYSPSFAYQELPWDQLLQNPFATFRIAAYGIFLTVESARHSFGNLPFAATLCGICLATASIVRYVRQNPADQAARGLQPWLLYIPALVALFAAMSLRHPPVMLLAWRRVYYPLPATAIWILLAMLMQGAFLRNQPHRIWAAAAIVVLIFVCNLGALREHRDIWEAGPYRAEIELGPAKRAEIAGRMRALATSSSKADQANHAWQNAVKSLVDVARENTPGSSSQ